MPRDLAEEWRDYRRAERILRDPAAGARLLAGMIGDILETNDAADVCRYASSARDRRSR